MGRQREIEAVTALLRRDAVRLLTLTGPGGVGKTRLAIRVAEETAADPSLGSGQAFIDGVTFVPLAPVRDFGLVLTTIAQALGVREAADQPLTDLLIDAIHTRRLLLVLDNMEHVLDAAPALADLLAGCPHLKVLATSRAHLRVGGEHTYAVPPLSLPEPDNESPSALATVEAVALFFQRAQAVQSDFGLTETNVASIAGICRRLDGLPLAIELAAARIRMFSPEALLARLNSRLPLLTGGARDQPARLQAMRAAIAWSFDLLSPDEQSLFRRLSVFVGGFTLESAEAVADEPAILDRLAALLDQSLVRQMSADTAEPRFGMLETIREYGLAQLAASGEGEATRRRHATWSLRLAERVVHPRTRPILVGWLDYMEQELNNLRVALEWTISGGDAETGLQLAGALAELWYFHEHRIEGRDWLERALARGERASDSARMRVLAALGMLEDYAGAHDRAIGHLEESLTLANALGDERGGIHATFLMGLAALHAGHDEHATALLEDVEMRSLARGEEWYIPSCRYHLGVLAHAQGALDQAEAFYESSRTLMHGFGDLIGMATPLWKLGVLAADRGDLRSAATRYLESIAILREIGELKGSAGWLASVATLAAAIGRPALAVRWFAAAEALGENTGYIIHLPERSGYEATNDELRATIDPGTFRAAWAAGWALPTEEAIEEASALLTTVTTPLDTGDPPVPAAHAGLSPREFEVLRLIVEGRTDREIAGALFISPRTVNTHTANIYAKLGVGSRAEAAVEVLRRGLI